MINIIYIIFNSSIQNAWITFVNTISKHNSIIIQRNTMSLIMSLRTRMMAALSQTEGTLPRLKHLVKHTNVNCFFFTSSNLNISFKIVYQNKNHSVYFIIQHIVINICIWHITRIRLFMFQLYFILSVKNISINKIFYSTNLWFII